MSAALLPAAAARRQVRRVLGGGLLLALGLTAVINVAVLVVPIYDMQLYDRVIMSHSMDTLGVLSVACVAGLALYAVLDLLRGACFAAIADGVGRALHGVVLTEGVRRAAAGDRAAGPEMVRDLVQVQGFLSSTAVAMPLDALCVPLGLFILYLLHPAFCFVALSGIAAITLVGLLTDRLVRPRLLRAQETQRAAGRILLRGATDADLAAGLGMLPAIGRTWVRRQSDALAGLDRAAVWALGAASLSKLVRWTLQGGVPVLGALLVLGGAATVGCLMGANLLTARVLQPFDSLVSSWRQWTLALAAWRRIDALLANAAPAPVASAAPAAPGLVVRSAEVAAPDGTTLLRGIDLAVPPGRLVAVTGPNGAGKTTLLRLLAGIVAPAAGEVLLDGVPVAGGAGVGFLPQGVLLLDGTVAENIARFGEAGLDGAVDAARRAEVHELIGRMGRGYETALAGNGAALSGGVKQRIGLARALHGTPRLLVLDEPDASLDGEGAAALLRALRAACDAGAICIVTTHRPALRDAADLIVALRDGRSERLVPSAMSAPRLATA